MKLRTLSVPVEAFDTTLDSLAASVDAAVDRACERLEAEGAEIVGISPVATATSIENFGDGGSSWSHERGLIVIVTYRTSETGD